MGSGEPLLELVPLWDPGVLKGRILAARLPSQAQPLDFFKPTFVPHWNSNFFFDIKYNQLMLWSMIKRYGEDLIFVENS